MNLKIMSLNPAGPFRIFSYPNNFGQILKNFKIRQWEKYFKYRYFYLRQYGKESHTTLNANAGKSKKNSGFTELI